MHPGLVCRRTFLWPLWQVWAAGWLLGCLLLLGLRGQAAAAPSNIISQLEGSVHRGLECPECHTPPSNADPRAVKDFGELPTRCVDCHAEAVENYQTSIHAKKAKGREGQAARCVDCHGSHQILTSKDHRSLVARDNLPSTCGQCHRNPELAEELGIHQPGGAGRYYESVHGMELKRGNPKAPNCVDCHGKNHGVFSADDPRSTISKAHIPETCGSCHEEQVDAYSKSIHGMALAQGDPKAPTCISCHASHELVRPTGKFKLASDKICGECHVERLSAYLETYHGRAHDLKSLDVAACFDCHGSHDILPSSNPASRLSKQNRGDTCRECHAGAPEAFMEFMAHGDYRDPVHYPMLFWAFVVMTGLILGTFGMWGIHTVLWMGRTAVVYVRDPAGFREKKQRARAERPGKMYTRFRPIDRFCHVLVIISFFLLVLTGMPLKFHDNAWAQALFDMLGGAERAALLHRIGAIISFSYLGIHLVSVIGPLRRKMAEEREKHSVGRGRAFINVVFGPDSPVPNLQDLKDARAHIRWFLGRGRKPRFDRFTYWEKFDYFAELWGSAFIGLSGLVMWFPELVSEFMPGWAVNLAQVIHSQEALLAAGFILTFHFFNSHFRLEKFPLDTVMFSGRVSEEEMHHERARQVERLAAEGRLEQLKDSSQWPLWKRVISNTFGMTALVLGMTLAVLMFWALGRLWLR